MVKLTNREREIYTLIKSNPFVTQKEIADQIGIKRSSVGVHIRNLMNKGQIKGRGYILDHEAYVAVIGGSNIDLVGFSNEKIILKDSNPGVMQTSLGGVARNIADNLCRLKVNVQMYSAVGKDLQGQKIINESSEIGIDMSRVIQSTKYNTSTYLSVVNPTGDMVLALSDMKSIQAVDIEYLSKYHKEISNSEVIVVDTNLDVKVLEYIFNKYQNHAIFVDTVSSTKAMKIKPYLNKIHTLKPNKIEAEKLLNYKIESKQDMEEAINQFLKKGVNEIIISNGDEEIYFGNNNSIGKIKPKRVDLVNANGAGDASMAGLVYGYLNNASIEESLQYAMAMSRLALESEKTISQLVSEEKINELVKEL